MRRIKPVAVMHGFQLPDSVQNVLGHLGGSKETASAIRAALTKHSEQAEVHTTALRVLTQHSPLNRKQIELAIGHLKTSPEQTREFEELKKLIRDTQATHVHVTSRAKALLLGPPSSSALPKVEFYKVLDAGPVIQIGRLARAHRI